MSEEKQVRETVDRLKGLHKRILLIRDNGALEYVHKLPVLQVLAMTSTLCKIMNKTKEFAPSLMYVLNDPETKEAAAEEKAVDPENLVTIPEWIEMNEKYLDQLDAKMNDQSIEGRRIRQASREVQENHRQPARAC